MVKVTYEPGPSGNETTTFRGRTVKAGEAFEIDDGDEEAVRKARNNPHFKVAGGKKANAPEPEEPEPGSNPPKSPTQSPMYPEAHLKQEVVPGGTMTAEQAAGQPAGTLTDDKTHRKGK